MPQEVDMWTPYDTINASLLLLDAPPYDEKLVAILLEDLEIYSDERQEIYQRVILAEHKLHAEQAEVARLRAALADCQQERTRNADAAARAIDELAANYGQNAS
jgi:hypothetical protein